MIRFNCLLGSLILIFAGYGSANAMTWTVDVEHQSRADIREDVVIYHAGGEIEASNADQLATLHARYADAAAAPSAANRNGWNRPRRSLVSFDSPGGNILGGLKLGRRSGVSGSIPR